jgi:CRP-like cAMP-binding protein
VIHNGRYKERKENSMLGGRTADLLRSDLLRGLKGDARQSLTDLAQVRSYHSFGQIVREGERADFLYCVLNGHIRLSKSAGTTREADIRICEPGDTFGECLVAGGTSYAYSAYAAEPTDLALLDLSAVRRLVEQYPSIERNIMRLTARHLLATMDCVASDRLHTASQKVAHYLLGRCPGDGPSATFKLPYQKRVLAGKLGLAPEALSRAFASLARAGVAVKGKTIYLENLRLLSNEAGDR